MFPFVNLGASRNKKISNYTAKIIAEVANTNISLKKLLVVTCLTLYQIILVANELDINTCEGICYKLSRVILLTI